jgi:hypothetical protein
MKLEKTKRPETTERTQARLRFADFFRSMFRRDGTAARQPVFSSLRSMRSFAAKTLSSLSTFICAHLRIKNYSDHNYSVIIPPLSLGALCGKQSF